MILVAGGDSFVYGAELADEINCPSQSTYPALLAKQHQMEYVCCARSGNANNAIARMTLAQCRKLQQQQKDFFVFVTWTFVHRYEFRFNYNTGHAISPWYSINSWDVQEDRTILSQFVNMNRIIANIQLQHQQNIKEVGIAEFSESFYRHVGNSEYYELYTSLKEIVFLQNYFKLHNIPYLFSHADITFQNSDNYKRRNDQFLSDLYEQIEWDNWYSFPAGTKPNETQEPRGFYQWAVENKYPVGTTHPLEEAHQDAAKLIKDKFNEMVNKSN